jgi:hypothetical protein
MRMSERRVVRSCAPMGPHGGPMGAVGAPWGPMGVRVLIYIYYTIISSNLSRLRSGLNITINIHLMAMTVAGAYSLMKKREAKHNRRC